MNRKSQVVGVTMLDCVCKSLREMSAFIGATNSQFSLVIYISSNKHLLGKELDVSLVAIFSPICAWREDVSQIRFQEPPVSKVGQLRVRVRCDFKINVQVVLAIFVQK